MTAPHIIGIISDSHDHQTNIRRAVEVFNDAGCSLVVHGGDFVAPFTSREFKHLACPIVGVFGNNDGERNGLMTQFTEIGSIHDAPYVFTHGGKQFALMHEPYYINDFLTREDIDVIIYGHIHKVDIRPGRPLVINPGESCSWLTGKATVVLLDLLTMEPRLVEL